MRSRPDSSAVENDPCDESSSGHVIVRRNDEDVLGVLSDQDVEHGGEVRDSVDGLLIDGDSATRNAASEQKILDILDMEIVG